tara:strand:+ start:2119 stop:2799 length:681 start_codon:yes stop_codon:yes gene_type:complete
MKEKIILTGSEGLLGKNIYDELSKDYIIEKVDLKLGHDLTNEKEVEKIFKDLGPSYGLINLFSINPQPDNSSMTLEEISLDSLRSYMEINIIALFNVCRVFSKYCKNEASIINFSSIYGINSPKHFIYKKGFEKHIGYSISKAGVIGMSKYLATYYAPRIRVNTIIPGGINNNQSSDFQKEYSKMTPYKRLAEPNEIISAVKYLLSKDSSYTTGSSVIIDGGWTSW